MSTHEFVDGVMLVVAVMAAVAALEGARPLVAGGRRRLGRRVANLGLMTLTLALNWGLTSAAAVAALALPLRAPGIVAGTGWPPALQLVASVAVLDVCFGYLAHRAMHRSPLLWRVHRVHHGDPLVDVTTTYRTHPLEVVWRFLFLIVPVVLLGIPAEAVVIYRLLSAVNGMLEHANLGVWQPIDRLVSLFWVTPNMHKVHHSRLRAETDSNYGNLFSIPDRLLGTFTPTARAAGVHYGLDDDPPRSVESLSRLLALPFVWRAEDAGAPRTLPGRAVGGMRERTLRRRATLVLIAATATAAVGLSGRAAGTLDGARIEELTGARGAMDAQAGVFKVSVPRTDLAVTVAGVKMVPALGLTSWAAFQEAGDRTMVMGDMVLTEEQVAPAMDAALANGLGVTALHNHFLGDAPKVMFMHVDGMGDETALATAIGRVFAAIAATSGGRATMPTAAIDPAATRLDPAVIDGILGVKGSLAGGVYKVVVDRTARMHGHPIGGAMGVNTWAAFAGSDQRAMVDGDVAMREAELQGVLKALRAAGILVVAIHNHMAMEEPRMLFLHFWGVGSTRALASGLHQALAVLEP